MKYSLRKYISAEEVKNRVLSSLKSYADSDLIIFDEYYKVIDLCNARLGLKLNPTKEALLKIENGIAFLPEDFLLLNIGLLVYSTIDTYNMYTIKKETLTGECPTLQDLMYLEDKCCGFKLECGKKPVLTCEYEDYSIEFPRTTLVRLTEKKYCSSDCFNINLSFNNAENIELTQDKIFFENAKDGYVYIQYQAKMNAEGNLPICLDNEIVLNYYEQALKYEILQDLYINKKLEIAQALQLVERKLLFAKDEALRLTRMPEFNELVQINNFLKKRYRNKNYLI